ncbi:MAG: YqgE/AlgH family protein [Lentisphaeria bacterium]|jgi:putative transcriptional regulator|nr:YqgE/AlgH family protein [Lentisphaeria bacterium]
MKPCAAKGDLLIAASTLLDPNFQQTVVLICENDPAKGTHGLILNRPISLPRELLAVIPFPAPSILFRGGPVQPDSLQVLHPFGERIPGAVKVLDGLYIGGDFDVLAGGLADESLDTDFCRFFLGYSGWSPGQLEGEFAEGAWLRVPGTAAILRETPPEDLWTEAVRRLGRHEPVMAHFPKEPAWN